MNTHDKFELPEPAGHLFEWFDGCGKRKAYYTEDQVVAAIEAAQPTVSVRSADELIAVIRDWLEQDNPAHYGPFEKRLVAIIDGKPDPALEADRKQQGEVVVTKDESGYIIAVTRQDDEGRILSVIAEADRQRRGEPVDRGPWKAGVNTIDSRAFIESADFTHDVRLYVDGDFADQGEKLDYAKGIADQLNAAPQTAAPIGAPTLHNKDSGAQNGIHAPQPAEQQTDVAKLVEALTELCDEIDKHEIHAAISTTNISWFKRKARKALAAHRKQGVKQ